ncbi:MAG: glycosyltransferase family 39 protein [Butyrivibrio sp.]|nr:glycosyltransferase family 39 protein [Butyrivibrio sp.]
MQKESNSTTQQNNFLDYLPTKPESIAVTLFIIAMGIYYFWRMFWLTPWYDELYTYYTFISKGPIYAAIHWPVPNNHVGYSVLSAFLDYSGISFIGLRGVSYICAIANLILIYRLACRYLSYWLSFSTVVIYSGFRIVNDLSVQGRGYTLSTTCFLVSVICIIDICMMGKVKKSTYIWFVVALFYGLYVVPTSIYWVIPVCLAGGLYLLINGIRTGKYREKGFWTTSYMVKLKCLVIAGVVAALVTLFLYSVIWLAIGCNYLTDDVTSAFYGMGHLYTLIHAPFKSYFTGIHLMTSTSYIQGSGRDGFFAELPKYFVYLFNYFLNGYGVFIAIVVLLALIILLAQCIRHFQYSKTLFNLIYICCIIFVPVMLFAQGNLPYLYLRIFSYGGVLVAFAFTTTLDHIINMSNRIYNRFRGFKEETTDFELTGTVNIKLNEDDKWYQSAGVYIPVVLICICFGVIFSDSSYHVQLGTREHSLSEALYMADLNKRSNICVTDFEEQYLLKFGWDIDCTNTEIEGSDMVILNKCMLTENYYGADSYLYFVNYDSIPWDYINSNLIKSYENEDFILFVK